MGKFKFMPRLAVIICAGVMLMSVGLDVSAQDAVTPETVPIEGLTLGEAVQEAGWPMYALGLMSSVAVGFIIYFTIVLRLEQIAPRTLRREVLNKINAGQLDEARKACEYRPCALSAITLSALDYLDSVPDADTQLLKDVIESEGQRQAIAIQDQTQYLMDIAVIAPMVGLLGTVVGMMRAFGSIATDITRANPMVLAGPVSQALITTVGGLLVGIPAMVFYSYFRGKSSRLISNMEVVSNDVLTALLRKRLG